MSQDTQRSHGPSDIPESTRQILRDSTFCVDEEPWIWLRATRVDRPELHLVVIRDDKETTVVTREACLRHLEVAERNRDEWHLLSIDCANPFYCVGFLSAITTPMALAGIDVLALSTFTRDYVFVKRADLQRARDALLAVGMRERAAQR